MPQSLDVAEGHHAGTTEASFASVFISHASTDNAAADRVRSVLRAAGFASIFLDFDPERGIPPGRRWEDELYAALRKSDIVVFLSTSASIASRWCHAELVLARALGRTIVPVVLESGATHPLLDDIQRLDAENADDEELARGLTSALERFTQDPRFGLPWDTSRSPYPGLHPFDESRAGVFFGRDDEIADVLRHVTWPQAAGSEKLVLVVGPSGCGKSSLVRAGVVAQLRRREGPWVVVPSFAPADEPFGRLGEELAKAFAASGVDTTPEACATRVRAGELAAIVRELCRAGDVDETRGGVVLIIDQAEQLVTEAATSRAEFLERIVGALEERVALRAIATLRDEYLSRLLAGTKLDGRATVTVPLGPISPKLLAQVIEKPAQRAGIDFEPGLVQRMVTETSSGVPSGGDPLPLLAFTLERVFAQRTSPTRITAADYDAVGGVAGALRTEADEVVERLTRRGRGPVIVDTLLELVHTDVEEVQPTGRTARRSDFDESEWEVVQAFVEARLLTTEGPGPSVSVVHESLLRDWPVLSDAIADARSRLLARTRLEREARVWIAGGRKPSDLLSAARLKDARRACAADPTWTPDSDVAEFVAESGAQARRGRAVTSAIAAAVAVGVLLLAAGGWTTYDRLRERARIHDARGPLVPVGAAELDRHEVTYAQYRLCIAEGRCRRPGVTSGAPDSRSAPGAAPVRYVDAAAAEAFCTWIGRRLPTVAELKGGADTAGVDHLLDGIHIGGIATGGREWTSTERSGARATPYHDPRTHLLETDQTNDATRPEPDLGFRCALS